MFESTNQPNETNTFPDFPIWESLDSDFPDEEQEHEQEPSISLDEDGFAITNEQQQDEQEEEIQKQRLFNENATGSSKGTTFAQDFYTSGADWSTLLVNSGSKKLKQTDLFQMWGIKKHKAVVNDDDGDFDEKKSKLVKKNDTQLVVSHLGKTGSDSMTGDRSRDSGVTRKGKFVPWQSSRGCPFYKKIPGTPFTVDAFRYGAIEGCSSYFLSHFHADHYGGLSKAWSYGPIYCTPITARLVRMCLSVDPSFPPKEEVMQFVVRTTKACLKRQPKTLIIVGAYSIGKECVYIAISEALRVKIYANASRRRILQSFGWPQLSGSLCSDGKDTPLHILPISSLRHETLKNYLKTYKDQFAAVVAFRPTGWTFSESVGNQLDLIKPNSKGNIQIYGVPYSEHSSFTEMKEFVQFLKPSKIIPTVNISNAASREKMQSYFRQWLNS